MGLVISRLNIEAPDLVRQRSQQDETVYSFYNQTTNSLSKKYFSNYFLMAGERFEVDDPDYLFGDENDLNFLSCTKPYYLPYKQAKQNLLSLLNIKQKTNSRVDRFRSPFSRISSRNANNPSRKQQQQDDNNPKRLPTSPSKPLIMFVNIRKETLKLVMDNNGLQTELDENMASNNITNKTALNSVVNSSTSSISIGISGENEGCEINSPPPSPSNNKIYNIQFCFDAEVDCSIRIFYFCTREITSNGINYKPQHATYKSKIYYYKKGLEQKFDQQDHTFQPYLFDEDLLMYKPLDTNGNYNSGAVFPLVIHCVALNGPSPKQSYSLVATIEKSQLDDSYSIKPLKQLIFVDGIQYILQDIYGIEHKQLIPLSCNNNNNNNNNNSSSSTNNNNYSTSSTLVTNNISNNKIKNFNGNTQKEGNLKTTPKEQTNLATTKSHSLPIGLDISSNLNLEDNGSITSVNLGLKRSSSRYNRDNLIRNKSLTSDHAYECVICMSEERDTMLLPCRHLCLCGSCAQSLRYQASSCPICRCTFKAALNLRPSSSSSLTHQNHNRQKQQQRSNSNQCNTTFIKQNNSSTSSSGSNGNSNICNNNNNANIKSTITSKLSPKVSSGQLSTTNICEESEEEDDYDDGKEQQIGSVSNLSRNNQKDVELAPNQHKHSSVDVTVVVSSPNCKSNNLATTNVNNDHQQTTSDSCDKTTNVVIKYDQNDRREAIVATSTTPLLSAPLNSNNNNNEDNNVNSNENENENENNTINSNTGKQSI